MKLVPMIIKTIKTIEEEDYNLKPDERLFEFNMSSKGPKKKSLLKSSNLEYVLPNKEEFTIGFTDGCDINILDGNAKGYISNSNFEKMKYLLEFKDTYYKNGGTNGRGKEVGKIRLLLSKDKTGIKDIEFNNFPTDVLLLEEKENDSQIIVPICKTHKYRGRAEKYECAVISNGSVSSSFYVLSEGNKYLDFGFNGQPKHYREFHQQLDKNVLNYRNIILLKFSASTNIIDKDVSKSEVDKWMIAGFQLLP